MVITAPVRTQVFLLNCDKSQSCILESRQEVELRRPRSEVRKRLFFLEVRPPKASVETSVAAGARKKCRPIAQNPKLRRQLEDDRSSVRRRVSLKKKKIPVPASYFET